MSKYTVVQAPEVRLHGMHIVTSDGVFIAAFRWAGDAIKFIEHAEYVEGVNAMCNAKKVTSYEHFIPPVIEDHKD